MFDLRVILVVGLGAGIGGILRLVVTQLVIAWAGLNLAPAATLFINVSGSFLIGVVVETAGARADLSPLWRYFLATGILGGYTTFSTFSLEALTISTAGFVPLSAAYVAGSVILGIAAAYGGVATARALAP